MERDLENFEMAQETAMEFTCDGNSRCTFEEVAEACELMAYRKDERFRLWLGHVKFQSNPAVIIKLIDEKYDELKKRKEEFENL